jgi:hypothetical protein
MSDEEYSALEFGKVLAGMEAQNKVLAQMQSDIKQLFSMIGDIQQQEAERCKEARAEAKGHDWGREIVIALLGALAYFILDHFISGGK